MVHEHAAPHRRHTLLIKIEPVDGLFEASMEEPDAGTPHYVMSGPPRPYGEVVEEVLEALRTHLLSAGE